MDCRDRILSNLYADLIIDFTPTDDYTFPNSGQDYCYLPVGDFYLAYTNRAEVSTFSMDLNYYVNTPNLYGLMENEFDPVSLISSGIMQIQRPPLSLTGQGVIIAFIDTGERVIIMSS